MIINNRRAGFEKRSWSRRGFRRQPEGWCCFCRRGGVGGALWLGEKAGETRKQSRGRTRLWDSHHHEGHTTRAHGSALPTPVPQQVTRGRGGAQDAEPGNAYWGNSVQHPVLLDKATYPVPGGCPEAFPFSKSKPQFGQLLELHATCEQSGDSSRWSAAVAFSRSSQSSGLIKQMWMKG